uniref:Condensin complex subunit 2 n=1 Tax=Glossina morsitans morsitans TaxID=37546 RepID=A0A1B0FNQ5_GLOMM
MTSDHKNSPVTPVLDVSLYQESNISDDAEKRREFERRTPTTAEDENVESSFTESGTLQNELEFYNNNKLGLENAWSFSLIDTLSTLLFNHHKTSNSDSSTILQIPRDFEGASAQVTRVTVPFARRTKVIDVDGLKSICSALLNEQLKNSTHGEDIPRHPTLNDERYEGGMASFIAIYAQLPNDLCKDVSTSIAFNSILHLANEQGLRLIPQEDHSDFKIRKLAD